MDGDVKQSTVSLTIGSTTRHYHLWLTTAPAAYDYGYTLHVYGNSALVVFFGDTHGKADREERLVLIPDAAAQHEHPEMGLHAPQVARYRSGMYRAEPSDLLPAEGQGGLEEILWAAIHSLHRGQD